VRVRCCHHELAFSIINAADVSTCRVFMRQSFVASFGGPLTNIYTSGR